MQLNVRTGKGRNSWLKPIRATSAVWVNWRKDSEATSGLYAPGSRTQELGEPGY